MLVQSPGLTPHKPVIYMIFLQDVTIITKQERLLHCPGSVAFPRGSDADSASTEFYIVIGQAPHHVDRNMSTIGCVIYDMSRV